MASVHQWHNSGNSGDYDFCSVQICLIQHPWKNQADKKPVNRVFYIFNHPGMESQFIDCNYFPDFSPDVFWLCFIPEGY
jgi:hypothetical protein